MNTGIWQLRDTSGIPSSAVGCTARSDHAHDAFTLIELLVVISIISLLISILLPALQNARAAAVQTKCLSQVRQLSLGINIYVGDFEGYIPNTGPNWMIQHTASSDSSKGSDVYGLWEKNYVPDQALICPSTPITPQSNPAQADSPESGRWAYYGETWKQWTGVRSMVNRSRTGTYIYVGGSLHPDHMLGHVNYDGGHIRLELVDQPGKYALWQDRVIGFSGGSWQSEFSNHTKGSPGGNAAFSDGSARWLKLDSPLAGTPKSANGEWWMWNSWSGHVPLGMPHITIWGRAFQEDNSVIDFAKF